MTSVILHMVLNQSDGWVSCLRMRYLWSKGFLYDLILRLRSRDMGELALFINI